MNIITTYVNPPVPTRKWDWMAHVEGDEEDGPTGRGADELEAVKHLADQLSDILADLR